MGQTLLYISIQKVMSAWADPGSFQEAAGGFEALNKIYYICNTPNY